MSIDSCKHEWIDKKTKYAPSEVGDRIESEKYCGKCGEGKYHRFVGYNNKENHTTITEYKPDWWGGPILQAGEVSHERARKLLAEIRQKTGHLFAWKPSKEMSEQEFGAKRNELQAGLVE